MVDAQVSKCPRHSEVILYYIFKQDSVYEAPIVFYR